MQNTYTVHNPTKSVRVIYDGIEGSQRQYAFQPGQTRTGIALSDAVVRDLVSRTRGDNKDADLRLRPDQSSQEQQQEPEKPTDADNGKRTSKK